MEHRNKLRYVIVAIFGCISANSTNGLLLQDSDEEDCRAMVSSSAISSFTIATTLRCIFLQVSGHTINLLHLFLTKKNTFVVGGGVWCLIYGRGGVAFSRTRIIIR